MSKRKAEPEPPVLRARQPGNSKQGVAGSRNFTCSDAIDHPDSNWNRAVSQTAQADPFCCRTEWQLSFHEAMQPNRRLIVRETPGSIVALAEELCPYKAPLLVPLESGWLFGCPLLGPDAIDLLEEIVSEVESSSPRRRSGPAVLVSGLRPRGALKRRLVERFGTRFSFEPESSVVLCNASLEGGLDGYLSRRSVSHRRGLRKQARRAALAGVTFERQAADTRPAAEEVYRRMLAVEVSSWKGIRKCGMLEQPSRDYYACMMRRLAVSGARFIAGSNSAMQKTGRRHRSAT
jgi:hypothetical protein